MRVLFGILFIIILNSAPAYAVQYICDVHRKFDTEKEYSAQEILSSQFQVKINERPSDTILSRCSRPPYKENVVCDNYNVNKAEYDESTKVKKFYVFKNQFDVQLFSNLTFIENNGRGGIAFGKCHLVSP